MKVAFEVDHSCEDEDEIEELAKRLEHELGKLSEKLDVIFCGIKIEDEW